MKIENSISYKIRGAIYEVYNQLGPGLLESVYNKAMAKELSETGLIVERETPIPVIYKSDKLDLGFRADLIIERKVIIEIKSIEMLAEVHHKQLLTYLKLTQLKLGILVNFDVEKINQGIFRKVNNL